MEVQILSPPYFLTESNSCMPFLCQTSREVGASGKQQVFLIYEQKLWELLRFCPKCGMLIEQESIQEGKNEG